MLVERPMTELPAGTVTFLFTDIEGSTRLLHELGERYADVLAEHRQLLREVFAECSGREVDTQGDSFFAAFGDAGDAFRAAVAAQRALAAHSWPGEATVRVRMGIHTGEPLLAGDHYVGIDVHRGARIAAAAHGGQVLISARTSALARGDGADASATLREVGTYPLKDLPEPERLFQLVVDGLPASFPPPRVHEKAPAAAGLPDYSLPPADVPCPYKGLVRFEREDSDLFFGREELVSALVKRVEDSAFLAVVGPSGSGKSSLVRAGVVPELERGEESTRPAIIEPGEHPLQKLPRTHDADFVVVDQFEEVFTLCRDEGERFAFIDQLLDTTEQGSRVVIVLRADFYGHCASHRRLAAALEDRQALIGPMTEEELRRAIDRPAEQAGLVLEPGLAEGILRDIVGEPGALPLLSHSLLETWRRRSDRMLTLLGYLQSGGVRGAIAKTAETVYREELTPQQKILARNIFLRLTELGEGTEDTRRRVRVGELTPHREQAEDVDEVLRVLVEARLVTVGEGTVEVAHEALIRHWPTLRAWLDEDREGRLAHRRLTEAAHEWEALGKDPGALYRGARLAAATEWADLHDDELNELEREYLDAAREAELSDVEATKRRNRRLRMLVAALAVFLVAALAAGVFALVQRSTAQHQARVAQAGRLAAQSRMVAAEHPDLALLLALEAGRLDDSIDTRGALLGALEHGSRIHAWLQGFEAPVNAAAFSPDGKLLATVTLRGTTLWDTAKWRPIGPPLRPAQRGGAEGVDFSPDGRTLAIAGAKGRVELWDVATRTKLRDLADPAAAASDEPALSIVRYSPDGSVIAAGAKAANHVTLWATASGRVIGEPIITEPPGAGAQSLAFSPDSERIAAPGAPGSVGIWEVATGRRVGKPLVIGSEDVESVIFARGGRALIASDDSGSVSMVDIATGRPIGSPLSVGDEPAASLGLSPDGRLLAAASAAGPVFVWDTETGAQYGSPLTADTSPVSDVDFSPDGRTLVSSHLRSAVVWDVSGEQAMGKPLGGPADLATDVSFSPDGTWLVAGRFDGDTVVYDVASRRRVLRVGGSSVVTAVAFHPDADLIAVGTIDGQVRFFDRKSGEAVGSTLDGGSSAVWQVGFSPDGRLLAVARDPNGLEGFYGQQRQGEVELWDVDSRRRVGRAIVPGGGSVLSVAFNREGTLLATGSYFGRLDLWDVATHARHGKPIRIADDGVLSVAFDASGRLVAGGGAIGPVRVWRVADQRPAFPPLSGHTGPVTGTAFDPAGSFLATSSLFGGTRLWDPATGLAYGDELVASPRPGSPAVSIDLPPFLGLRNAFSPDGKLLAVAGVETHAMLWDVDPAVWRERACAIVGRNLSREEWNLYLPPGAAYRATCSGWPIR
jgi:WD40 repeat protein/class 3 adenylate cyclase/energy-coupling factor transporter ATP-binding protein EcfA2